VSTKRTDVGGKTAHREASIKEKRAKKDAQ